MYIASWNNILYLALYDQCDLELRNCGCLLAVLFSSWRDFWGGYRFGDHRPANPKMKGLEDLRRRCKTFHVPRGNAF